MDELKNKVLEEWLEIEFTRIANKIGFINKTIIVEEQLIYSTIRCLDYETTMIKNPNDNYIITIICLMWGHVDHERYFLKDVVIKFLSRIGYPTSAIICDNEFNIENCSFGELNSLIDKIYNTMNQLKNEVSVGKKQYLLTDFQKKIWDAMCNGQSLGISAPTSAGKSFTILLNVANHLLTENVDVIYIVPTISLLNQVTEDFSKELKRVGVNDYWITNSFKEDENTTTKKIYVMTQEKAISAISNYKDAFQKDLILVIDEIQNIERITDDIDQRSKILFDVLTEFRQKNNVKQIIISGPRINKIHEIGEEIFGIKMKNISTKISPVLNLTYAISKVKNQYFIKQYCSLLKKPNIKEIENSSIIKEFGKKRYTQDFYTYLNRIINGLGRDKQNIIFAPTSETARKIAINLQCSCENSDQSLIQYYKDTIRDNYALCISLENGVAYHHGKLPLHVRRTLEKAISEKKIHNVVCTTTLLQGVNLPAQNIIIRNPHLYQSKIRTATELSNYEMANLRGRAGRLLKDNIGRTFVLEENTFNEETGYEGTLFDEETKDLPTGYQQRFEEYKNQIEEVVGDYRPVDSTMNEYGYLISYIRQNVLRYGLDSKSKMKNVGIDLTKEQIAAIKYKLDDLKIPREICYKNRYWDPFVLDKIYTNFNLSVPNDPFEKGARNKLNNILKYLRDTKETSLMYEKSIPSNFRNGKGRSIMVNKSIEWAGGKKLKEILDEKYYDENQNIEDTIQLLQNTVSFYLPNLLKPIYDIKLPESSLLICMQLGATDIVTRSLIEMGIPRETAIFLKENIFCGKDFKVDKDENLETIIRKVLKEKYLQLPYWIQVQLEFLIE